MLHHLIGVMLVVGFVAFFMIVFVTGKSEKQTALEEAEARRPFDPHIVCPHCHTKGSVQTEKGWQKQGISGAKATGAILTAGVSMLATGLSRKQSGFNATCGRCGMGWFVA